ncbi:MAG: VIT domain-containing protein [Oligosphaeraceae bacterium]
MKLHLLSLLSLALPAALTAQAIVPAPPRPLPLPLPTIVLPPQTQAKPIQTTAVDIQAEIAGFLARTSVTLTLHNPNSQTLEGELLVPLPAGATIAGYALDVNGAMVDGVIVGKTKAKVVFEEVVRQGIDPGLVDQAAGNTFRTRVYPLPPSGSRTVRYSYVAPLLTGTEDGADVAYYQQPLRFPNRLQSFRLSLSALAAEQPPIIVQGKLSGLSFANWQTVHTASVELRDIELTEDLLVAVPAVRHHALLQKSPADGLAYLAAAAKLDLPKAAPRPLSDVTILWDASLSRAKSDHTPELQLLETALKDCRRLTLIVFRHLPEPPQRFDHIGKLLDAIRKTPFDGATNLTQALAAIPPHTTDAILLSDGLDTFPDKTPVDLPKGCRLSAVFTDKDQNAPALRRLTASSGGLVADLRATSPADAAPLLATPTAAVRSVSLDGQDVTAATVWKLDGQHLQLAVTLPQPLADARPTQLTVTLADGTDIRFPSVATLPDGPLVRTFCGSRLIEDLIAQDADETALAQASRRFQLVSPVTSLLVLDSLQQYLQYGVRPPETLPDWRVQYDRQHQDASNQDDRLTLPDNDLKRVAQLWQGLVDWHSKDFPSQPPKPTANKPNRPGFFARLFNARANEDAMVGAAAPAPATDARRSASVQDDVAHIAVDMAGAPAAMAEHIQANLAPESRALAKAARRPDDGAPSIALKPWSSDAPYLRQLKDEEPANAYSRYLQLRDDFLDSPGFYMDCADFFRSANQPDLAIRILSNLAEIKPDDAPLLRICAYQLRFAGQLPLAEILFRAVIPIAPHEPQSYRDLALTLDDQQKFQEAADVMLTLVKRKFDDRFPEIEVIALVELNRIIARAQRQGITIANVDKNLVRLIDTDLRVVLNWDADMTDMDLWTTDRFGEKCFYGHRLTATGGHNSCDFTRGYGPEEFMIRKAVDGDYTIEANYYGSNSQKILGPVTLYAEVFTHYGRPNEQKQVLTFRLTGRSEVVKLGTVSLKQAVKERPATATHYQVKLGDTLASIAKTQLGDETRADDILKLNPHLTTPNRLTVGIIIQLPPRND